ncbi:MAG: M61 family metallopeptidase [Ignavibacteria bacterium]
MITVLFIILISIPLMTSAQNTKITYTLGMSKPTTHLFEVNINFAGLPENEKFIELMLPVWRPGRYLIFDFASGVQEFQAFDDNNVLLKWAKINKSTWRIETNSLSKISVSYKVYANEFNSRTRGLNDEHGFVDGTSVFMYSEKYRKMPLELKVIPYKDWHVTTGLENMNGDPYRFSAPDYDYFVDCPLEIGNQRDIEFFVPLPWDETKTKKHIISFFGEADYDKDLLIKDLTRIIQKNFLLWEKIPYDKFVFIIHCTPHSSGGTEHINSTIIGTKASAFETTESYNGFLRLISHEFFHTWNVKQFRPKGLTPYDYTKENYTEELWIAEGGTSYYDGLMVLRTGIYDVEDFYKEIIKSVEEERRRPGNRLQSVAESSFDAWVKYWKGNPQSYNAETDYYNKGAAVSLVLDLEIRSRTNNKHSLDDVFRTMFERFPLGGTGYSNSDFQKVCEELCSSSFQQFFDDFVYGTEPIEWEKFLSYAGIELSSEDSTVVPVAGLIASQRSNKIIISEVISGSSAEDAGFLQGDEIVAVDGSRLSYREMEERIKELNAGENLKLTIFRNDKLKEFTLTLQNRKIANYNIKKISNPTDLQKAIYESWLEVGW